VAVLLVAPAPTAAFAAVGPPGAGRAVAARGPVAGPGPRAGSDDDEDGGGLTVPLPTGTVVPSAPAPGGAPPAATPAAGAGAPAGRSGGSSGRDLVVQVFVLVNALVIAGAAFSYRRRARPAPRLDRAAP